MANYVFPKVEQPKILHSNRDLSLYKVASLSVGPLYPILAIDVLPDDWMKINTTATIESMPMIAPVMGRWKVSFDYFLEPWSNLYGFIDNNYRMSTQSIVGLDRYTLALGRKVALDADENGYISPEYLLDDIYTLEHTSLLDYLGISPGFCGKLVDDNGTLIMDRVEVPAEKFMTYFDIVRNYYVNNQEGVMKMIGRSYGDIVYKDITLQYLDERVMAWRADSTTGGHVLASTTENYGSSFNDFYNTVVGAPFLSMTERLGTTADTPGASGRKAGLALRTYRMDLLRGIMNDSVGEYQSFVSVTRGGDGGDGFSIDTLRFANKLQKFIDRIDLSGGRFSDYIRTRWAVDTGQNIDRPIYLGSHSTWLSTIDIVATAAGQSGNTYSNNPNSQLGQQSGYIAGSLGSGKQRPITFKSRNYCTLMCILSIVPEVVYSQGIELENLKTRFMDIYDPAFGQLGYQDVSRYEVSALPNFTYMPIENSIKLEATDVSQSVGKRIAWSEYMASLNRAHGDFAYGGSLDYWVLGRKYTTESDSTSYVPLLTNFGDFDNTTYVKPDLWNGVFSDKSLSADNFRVAVRFEIDSNRALGKRIMPHL